MQSYQSTISKLSEVKITWRSYNETSNFPFAFILVDVQTSISEFALGTC
jgi:hypothetical protein